MPNTFTESNVESNIRMYWKWRKVNESSDVTSIHIRMAAIQDELLPAWLSGASRFPSCTD